MFELGEQATELYPIGAGVLATSTWAPFAIAAAFIAAGAILIVIGRVKVHSVVTLALGLTLMLAGGSVLATWALNYFEARSVAAELRSR